MTQFRLAALGLAGLALSACDTATPPTISQADIAAAIAERERIGGLPVASVAQRPIGTVDYTGNLFANITVDAEPGYSVLGDMDMRVGFGSGAVSGTVHNINLIDSGMPDQLLGGMLNINGSQSSGGLIATASGEIDAVSSDLPFRGTTEVALQMSGTVRADGTGTAVFGTVVGGSTSFDDDFFVLVTNGTFFGTD